MSTAVEREPHTYYSPERKAEVLAMVTRGSTAYQVAQETGISHQLISYWIQHEHRYSNLLPEKQAALDAKLEQTANKYLDSIYSHDLANAPLNHKATTFGIVFDKLQLVRGLPTSITETVNKAEIVQALQAALSAPIDITPED